MENREENQVLEAVQPKKLTLDDLLAKELNLETSKTKEYESKELGGVIEFVRVNPEKISDCLAEMNQEKCSEFNTYQRIIHLSCPMFKDKKLIEKYNPVEPFQVVYKLLNNSIAEVYDMGNTILDWYGFDRGDQVKK